MVNREAYGEGLRLLCYDKIQPHCCSWILSLSDLSHLHIATPVSAFSYFSLLHDNFFRRSVAHADDVQAFLQLIQLLTVGRIYLDILRLCQNHLPDACGITCMYHHIMRRHRLSVMFAPSLSVIYSCPKDVLACSELVVKEINDLSR